MTLEQYINKKLAQPFVWGVNDCVLFVAGWVYESTGKDYTENLQSWNCALSAQRAISKVGGLESYLSSIAWRIDPKIAIDGDVALRDNTLLLFYGSKIIGPGANGIDFIDRKGAQCAWQF